jgi:hypothetical protein
MTDLHDWYNETLRSYVASGRQEGVYAGNDIDPFPLDNPSDRLPYGEVLPSVVVFVRATWVHASFCLGSLGQFTFDPLKRSEEPADPGVRCEKCGVVFKVCKADLARTGHGPLRSAWERGEFGKFLGSTKASDLWGGVLTRVERGVDPTPLVEVKSEGHRARDVEPRTSVRSRRLRSRRPRDIDPAPGLASWLGASRVRDVAPLPITGAPSFPSLTPYELGILSILYDPNVKVVIGSTEDWAKLRPWFLSDSAGRLDDGRVIVVDHSKTVRRGQAKVWRGDNMSLETVAWEFVPRGSREVEPEAYHTLEHPYLRALESVVGDLTVSWVGIRFDDWIEALGGTRRIEGLPSWLGWRWNMTLGDLVGENGRVRIEFEKGLMPGQAYVIRDGRRAWEELTSPGPVRYRREVLP